MRQKYYRLSVVILGILFFISCDNKLEFADIDSIDVPQISDTSSQYLWIGPEYKLAINAKITDEKGIHSVQIINAEWGLDTIIEINGNPVEYQLKDTFLVAKDVNKMQHDVDLSVKNVENSILKTKISVKDLSESNQIPGYSPDILPPTIQISAPTQTRFYGLKPDPITIDVTALIKDIEEIADIYVKIWGESYDGTFIDLEDNIIPVTEDEKKEYNYTHQFTLPGGLAGEYQYMVRATDASGNKSVLGANLMVGVMDRLYLSDAKNEDEVTKQGFDAYASASTWGIGTLLAMKQIAVNKFSLDYYYRNDTDENIRFVAFLGNDRPFGTSSRTINYTLTGDNVLGLSSTQTGKITENLSEASFKLPVSEKGYYTIVVDMNTKTVEATPMSGTNPAFSNPTYFPGFSPDNTWNYMPIIAGGAVVGTSGWSEVNNNTSLHREVEHKYIYSGEFTTAGGVNISFMAPKSALPSVGNVGWFRLPAARANMKDAYGDLISQIAPVGASSSGANYGISLTGNRNYHASYDLVTYRLRIVQK